MVLETQILESRLNIELLRWLLFIKQKNLLNKLRELQRVFKIKGRREGTRRP